MCAASCAPRGRRRRGRLRQGRRSCIGYAFGADGLSLSEYIDWACDHAARMMDVHLEVAEGTEEERAAAFVDAMVGAELAEKLGS